MDSKRIEALKVVQRNAARSKHQALKLAGGLTPERNVYPPMIPEGAPFTKQVPLDNQKKGIRAVPHFIAIDPDLMHPHMMGILGIAITPEIISVMKTIPLPHAVVEKQQNNYALKAKQKEECPKCKGKGFQHYSTAKHAPKKDTGRCKKCSNCKACSGTGTVFDVVGCTACELRGFIHSSNEREHDVSPEYRCFFCKDCSTCKGLGVMAKEKPPNDIKSLGVTTKVTYRLSPNKRE